MTPGLRPYRWFGRDAATDWSGIAAVADVAPSPGPAPGPPPKGGGGEGCWAWLGALDRSRPGQRSVLWARQTLEELRVALEAALGVPLAWPVFLGLWAQDLEVSDLTAPGQRPAAQAWLSQAVLALTTGDAPALRRLGPPPVTEGRFGALGEGRWVVAHRSQGWAPIGRPRAYYEPGTLEEPLRVVDGFGDALEPVARALRAGLPDPVHWRTDFWLLLLQRFDPRAIVSAVGRDDEVLWRATRGTPAAGPMLATAGEARLASGTISAEDALDRPPRGVACCLGARGITDLDTVRLWIEARDPTTGLLVASRAGRIVGPLRSEMLGEGRPQEVARLLLRAHAVGGSEGVSGVLDVLFAEGASTPTELRATFRGMGTLQDPVAAAVAGTVYAGWMGIDETGG